MRILYLGSMLLGVGAFAPAMLAPGYVLAAWANVCGFRGRSRAEQLLWSLTLSAPLATLIAVYGGLLLGRQVGWVYVALAVVAAVFFLRQRTGAAGGTWSRGKLAIVGVVSLLAVYLLLAGAPYQSGDRLYEGIVTADWSVRVPLVDAAIRTGMPLVNPFYAVGGHVGPMRYYYYWYALAGAVGSVSHLPARAVMAAGTVWAGWLMLATLFLLLKYVFRPERTRLAWVSVCLGCVAVMPVIGLDVLQALRTLVTTRTMYPEIEWWRAGYAFSPSFHTFFLYAPHHTFGVCAGLVGWLVLLAPRLPGMGEGGASWARTLGLGVVAGVCFGAMAGTSTYVAICFALACVLLLVSFALRRDWTMIAATCVAGLVGLAGAWNCLHSILANPAKGAEGAFVQAGLRGWSTEHRWYAAAVLLVVLAVAEAGVFTLVLVARVRADFATGQRLPDAERYQWMLVGAFLVCAVFLTSKGTIGTNDLGFHAGFLLRVVAVLWTAPWVAELWLSRERRRTFVASGVGRLAVVLVLLGLGTQLWQVVGQRFMLRATGKVVYIPGPFPSPPELPERYFEARRAWDAVNRLLPADAVVLTNPDSPQRSMGLLYVNRQLVAPEPKCMAAFGGDPVACRTALPAMRAAFVAGTVADLHAACADNGATAVLVSREDAVWGRAGSWVWSEPALYAGERERLYRCR